MATGKYSAVPALSIGSILPVLIILTLPLSARAHMSSTATATSTQSSGTSQIAAATSNPFTPSSDKTTDTFIEPTASIVSPNSGLTSNPPSSSSSGLSPTLVAVIGNLTSIAVFIFTMWQGWQAVIYLRREHRKRMETLEVERQEVELRAASQHAAK
ncbi:hypothetical protein FRB94_013522 [Tulasnella sp. JGI-2019a]|nr:hypothetical protein FRB94_013522 [Tulasnella sp. JGI-2019a]